jgi:hypothetical protein
MTKAFPFIMVGDIKIEPKVFLIDGFLGRDEQSAFKWLTKGGAG